MKIHVSFYESANYTFENAESFIRIDPIIGKDCPVSKINEIGKELEKVLIEDYFNGADLAARYLGYSLDNEYFEFELIPNI